MGTGGISPSSHPSAAYQNDCKQMLELETEILSILLPLSLDMPVINCQLPTFARCNHSWKFYPGSTLVWPCKGHPGGGGTQLKHEAPTDTYKIYKQLDRY